MPMANKAFEQHLYYLTIKGVISKKNIEINLDKKKNRRKKFRPFLEIIVDFRHVKTKLSRNFVFKEMSTRRNVLSEMCLDEISWIR